MSEIYPFRVCQERKPYLTQSFWEWSEWNVIKWFGWAKKVSSVGSCESCFWTLTTLLFILLLLGLFLYWSLGFSYNCPLICTCWEVHVRIRRPAVPVCPCSCSCPAIWSEPCSAFCWGSVTLSCSGPWFLPNMTQGSGCYPHYHKIKPLKSGLISKQILKNTCKILGKT